MKVAIEDIKQWLAWRSLWNSTSLKDIEFTLKGKPINIQVSEQILDDNDNVIEARPITTQQFKRWGLANVDYLLMALASFERGDRL